jgi:hypothetical protein
MNRSVAIFLTDCRVTARVPPVFLPRSQLVLELKATLKSSSLEDSFNSKIAFNSKIILKSSCETPTKTRAGDCRDKSLFKKLFWDYFDAALIIIIISTAIA